MAEVALIVLAPLIIGALLAAASRRLGRGASWALAVAALATSLASAVCSVLHGGSQFEAPWGAGGPIDFSLLLAVDGLSAPFILAASAISLACLVYSVGYVAERPQTYAGLFLLFASGILGCLASLDMLSFYLFWELMVWSSYALIRLYGEREDAGRISLMYLLISHLASSTLLFGFLTIHALRGTFNMAEVRGLGLSTPLEAFAAASIVVGLLIKMGVAPILHIWLPDAHSEAPAPISAMLSGLMIEVAAFGFLRVVYGCWSLDALRPAGWLIWGCGLVMLSYAAMTSFAQHDVKRFMAYSSINEMGLAAFALGLLTRGGVAAAVVHVLNHEVVKSLLFMYAGCIVHEVGVRDVRALGDMLWFMPEASVAGLIASLSIIGVPGLNMFVGELMIYMEGVEAGLLAPTIVAAVMMAVFSAAWLRFINRVMLTRRRLGRVRVASSMLAPMMALASACVVLGVYPEPLYMAGRMAAAELLG